MEKKKKKNPIVSSLMGGYKEMGVPSHREGKAHGWETPRGAWRKLEGFQVSRSFLPPETLSDT